MWVQEVITPNGDIRYMVIDADGDIIEPIHRFLKFKDNAGRARNTLRAYCYHLKAYFEFLKQKEANYCDVGIDDMAEFFRWLQTPNRNVKVVSIKPVQGALKANTVNTYISSVMEFYDYLMRVEDYSVKVSQRLKKQVSGSRRGFKDYLYHINKNKDFDARFLKVKAPKQQPRILTNDQVSKLLDACSNIRDKFLIQLLWESGFRIGECLSLHLEDFITDARQIDLKDRGELPNLAEIKTVNSPRKIDVSADLMDQFFEYLVELHVDEVDTNFVFIKLSGKNKHQPLEYADVNALFKRLKKKTGIHVTSHMFRHTHFDTLRKAGWGFEKIRLRGGWSDVQTPMQVYSHPSDEEMREEWEKAEARIKVDKNKEGYN